jgi:hypothetical protein
MTQFSIDKSNLTKKFVKASNELNKLLIDEGSKIFIDLEKDVDCKTKLDELRRLIMTLEQYSIKSRHLEYIGFLGHFSSGKSSTINSILQMWNTAEERNTNLHPTDDSVTLATHKDNSHLLIGTHRKGELKVGSQYVNIESLKDRVLVDTPGLGDPLILEEMIKDFLPICDSVIYFFSATNPLDNNDVPILEKFHNELPFIPIKFIVTRANEFIKDRKKGFNEKNIDEQKIDKFTSELIARLNQIIPSRSFVKSDFLFIDNLYEYNINQLNSYVFLQRDKNKKLHDHKINYFISNIREIREFFKTYIDKQINTLNRLVSTASSNHDKYKDSYQMGKSDLTESWAYNYEEFKKKDKSLLEKTQEHKKKLSIPENINNISLIKKYKEDIDLKINRELDYYVKKITDSMVEIIKLITPTVKQAVKDIIYDNKLEKVDIYHISDIKIKEYGYTDPTIPSDMSLKIERLETELKKELDDYKTNFNDSIDFLLKSSTQNNWLIQAEDKITEESQKELSAILQEFYAKVTVYKGAILAIDARDFAEKLKIGKAIDELDRIELTEENKSNIKTELFDSIYSGRVHYIDSYSSEMKSLRNKLLAEKAKKDLEYLGNDYISRNNSINLNSETKEFLDHIFPKEDIKQELINKAKGLVIEYQKSCRDEIIEEKQKFRTRLLRRLAGASFIGLAVGTFVILTNNSFITKIPYLSDIVDNSIGNSIITEAFFILLAIGIAWLFNDLKADFYKNIKDIPDKKKSELLKEIDHMEIEKSVMIDSKKADIQEFILKLWRQTANEAIDKSVSNLQEYHKKIYDKSFILNDYLDNYKNSSVSFLKQIMIFYNNSESNLKILAEISDKIKEDAIEPSFKMFKEKQKDLEEFSEKIKNIEFI